MLDKQDELKKYEQLFRQNYQQLCHRVFRITRDMVTAEDIVQEVFVAFWNNTTRLEIENQEAYLYTAALNKALNHATTQKRRLELNAHYLQQQPMAESNSQQQLEHQELEQLAQSTIAALPPMCQKVFMLRRYEEMTHKQIAAFLNISPNTVDNHIKKALSILRKALLSLSLILTEIYLHFFS